MITDDQQGVLRMVDLPEDHGHWIPRKHDKIHPGHLTIAPVMHPAPDPCLPGRRGRHYGGTHLRFRTQPRFDGHCAQSSRLGPAQNLTGLVQDSEAPLGPVHRCEDLREVILVFRNEQAGNLTAPNHRVGGEPESRVRGRAAEKSTEDQEVRPDLLRPPDDLDPGDPGPEVRSVRVPGGRAGSVHDPKHIQARPQVGGEAPGNGDRVLPGERPIGGRKDLSPCHGWTVGEVG